VADWQRGTGQIFRGSKISKIASQTVEEFGRKLAHSAIFGIFCAKSLNTGRKRNPHRRTQRSPGFKSANEMAKIDDLTPVAIQ
jgi:hypothetical protein